MELPNCEYASEIISDGDDYFVSGKSTKDKVGYWKNGKWNTLHVDFIENVSHETQGIGKWDSYIYLYDPPYVLKNSGMFPLDDCEDFNASSQCISVSNGKCYLAGMDYHGADPSDAVLYYDYKGRYAKAILPKPNENVSANATTIFAYNTDHTIIESAYRYQPMRAQIRYGYSLPLTDFLSVTPQIGGCFNYFNGTLLPGYEVAHFNYMEKCVSGSGLLALRLNLSPTNWLKFQITPEYNFALAKNAEVDFINNENAKFKHWTEGFNLNIGLMVFF
jgi:hypothetical protein